MNILQGEKIFNYSNVEPFINNELIENADQQQLNAKGCIHRLRVLPNVAFVIIRLDRSLIQGVVEETDFQKI